MQILYNFIDTNYKTIIIILVLVILVLVIYLYMNTYKEGMYEKTVVPHTHFHKKDTQPAWYQYYNDPKASGIDKMYNVENAYDDNHIYEANDGLMDHY